MTGDRAVNDDVKFNLISLIIELGNPKYGLAKMFGLGQHGLYDMFFTGKNTVNRHTMGLLLVLIDFGVGLGMAEAEDLHEHLYRFCGDYSSNKDNEEEDTDTECPRVIEATWAWRLANVFRNLGNTPTAPNFVLRHLLYQFNKVCTFYNCKWLIKSHLIYWIVKSYLDNCSNSGANTCTKFASPLPGSSSR